MKKYLLIAIFGVIILASSKPVYAANHIYLHKHQILLLDYLNFNKKSYFDHN